MREKRIDWTVLRGAMALLVGALLVGGGLVFAAEWYTDRAQRRYVMQDKSLSTVRSSYQQVDEEKLIMEQYLPLYGDLIRAGVVGPEHRLTWVEALRRVARELSLPTLRYQIGAQSEHRSRLPLETGQHRVYRTVMTLDVGLFHEGDLPRVLQALRGEADGLFSVDGCSLTRTSPKFGMDPGTPNLEAQCVVSWYTLRMPDA